MASNKYVGYMQPGALQEISQLPAGNTETAILKGWKPISEDLSDDQDARQQPLSSSTWTLWCLGACMPGL